LVTGKIDDHFKHGAVAQDATNKVAR